MATKTTNLYGKIVVTNRAIKSIANFAIRESYGIADGKVTYIVIEENKIDMAIVLHLKYGVNPHAISESIRSVVKYNVENFTGMSVGVINISIVGIK
ncbi:MAG: Asp23/Gls24 family envelope stress response protein [Firmicutes bacterium]|nr:Asp23/Gls24 family envelope stress response protein [Bacillota bacterium]